MPARLRRPAARVGNATIAGHGGIRRDCARRRRRRPVLRRHRRAARPARAAHRPCAEAGRENPHLWRRTLQLHQSATSSQATSCPPTRPFAARRWPAIRRPTSWRWCARHGIAFHEKHRGQLFCDDSSEQHHRDAARPSAPPAALQHWQPCVVHAVRHGAGGFELDTERGTVLAPQLVVATGGLSIPKIGASDLGYRLAASSATASSSRGPGWCR